MATLPYTAELGVTYTGFTVGYTLYNTDGTVYQARTTAGVFELPSGTGTFNASITTPDSFAGYAIFDTGTGKTKTIPIVPTSLMLQPPTASASLAPDDGFDTVEGDTVTRQLKVRKLTDASTGAWSYYDLTGCTVKYNVADMAGNSLQNEIACTIADAANGVVNVPLSGSVAEGNYQLELVVTTAGGQVFRAPTATAYLWTVRAKTGA